MLQTGNTQTPECGVAEGMCCRQCGIHYDALIHRTHETTA